MPLPPRPAAGPGPTPPGGLDRSRCRLVWLLLAAVSAAAPVLAAVGSAALGPPPIQGPGQLPVLAVLALAVLADAIMAFVLPGMIRRRAGAGALGGDAAVSTQFIVAGALGTGCSLMTAVALFLTGEAGVLALLVLPATVLLAWFPSEARWQARRPQGAPEAAHRMMRG